MTAAEIVLDASVALRGLLGASEDALDVVDAVASGDTSAHAPDLIVAEVVNALKTSVDANRWLPSDAERALRVFLAWPLVLRPCGPLSEATLALAVERGLSAYDGYYATLAEALDVTLVTADRRLADAVPRSQLVA